MRIQNSGDDQVNFGNQRRSGATGRAVDYLYSLIDLRRVLPGDPLPSANVLAVEIGVNRTAVLEALHLLEHEGLVKVRPGKAGARVTTREERSPQMRLARAMARKEDMQDIVVLREILEAGIARRVATNGLPAPLLERAKAIVEELKVTTDPDVYMALDTEFHEILAEGTGSPIPRKLVNSLRGVFVVGLDASELSQEYLAESNRDHECLLSAIEAREPAEAAEWALRHAGRATTVIAEALGSSIKIEDERILAAGGAATN